MWTSLLIIIACLVVFERASNYLVEALGAFSKHFGISEAVLGASVAAMGSSAPEFASSAFSVVKSHPTIGLGTIVGSAIFNVTVIIGGSALIGKFAIEKRIFYRDGLFYLLTVGVAIFGVSDGYVSRFDAISWTLIFIGYFVWLLYDAKKGKPVPHEYFEKISLRKAVSFLVISLLAIGIAARFLVIEVATLTSEWGISEAIFSLIVVAVGTSVPDFFTSLQAARKGMGSLAVANALGSNIFDILACLGIPFAFRSMTEVETGIHFSLGFLLASLGIALAILRYRWSVTKKEGAILVATYGCYLALVMIF